MIFHRRGSRQKRQQGRWWRSLLPLDWQGQALSTRFFLYQGCTRYKCPPVPPTSGLPQSQDQRGSHWWHTGCNRSDTVYWQGEIPHAAPAYPQRGEPVSRSNRHKNLSPHCSGVSVPLSREPSHAPHRTAYTWIPCSGLRWIPAHSRCLKHPPRLYWFRCHSAMRGCPNLSALFSCSAPWRGLSGLSQSPHS